MQIVIRFVFFFRGFSQDEEPRGTSLQRTMSRPTGKSIYMQRKEYAETLNRQQDTLNARVEHLLTCELDGHLLKTVEDCVAKLRRLEAKGRLWPQNMIMDVQGPFLVLSDIETKAELESIPLSYITQTKSLEDNGSDDNSLLIITVQDRNKRVPQVFMFQCEETSGDIVKADLDKAVQRGGGGDLEPFREHSDIRSNLENIIGLQAAGGFRPPVPQSPEYNRRLPPSDFMSPQWNNREPENMPPPRSHNLQEDMMAQPGLYEQQNGPQIPDEKLEIERSMEIFNHVINDLEIFMGQVTAAMNMPQEEEKKKKKKKSKKKKSQKNALPDNLPSWEEYVSFLQKIKYGFNLLSKLEGVLTPVSAPDYVHIFFQFLDMIVPQYPSDLPPTVVSPMLTEAAIEMLGQVLGREEYRLWRSLGECWFVPRSNWPEKVPPYIPEFYDGWQPPAPPPPLSPQLRHQNGPMSRSNSQRFQPDGPGRIYEEAPYSPRASLRQPEEPMGNGPWNSMPPPSEPPALMQAIYNFNARNNRELSLMKGEMVQVVNKAKQWWLVRNSHGEEGNVPLNILEPASSSRSAEEPPVSFTASPPFTLRPPHQDLMHNSFFCSVCTAQQFWSCDSGYELLICGGEGLARVQRFLQNVGFTLLKVLGHKNKTALLTKKRHPVVSTQTALLPASGC
uniref:EPS8-like 3b n=1 Tax=Oryzias latipes TaxID=8090 RepID=A0A3P9M628_ORYLA